MFNEDNTGFINFPVPDGKVLATNNGCTLVYLVAFEEKFKNKYSKIDNVSLTLPGLFVSDDVINRPDICLDVTLDELLKEQSAQNNYDSMYFPDMTSIDTWKRQKSIDFISSICIGWCDNTYEYKNGNEMWNATFKDLTNEGINMYYGIKKLHNNKEVRILTFNTN